MRTAAFTGAVALVAASLAAATPAAAQSGEDRCFTTDPPPVTRPAAPVRFGITPGAAGSAGGTQGTVVPEDQGAAIAALRELRPPGKALVLRLNRLFWADGAAGIRRFAALVDRYAAAGFTSELQVRYHPPEGAEGDIPRWERFVRAAVRELGRRRSVVAFSITNEANFPGSANTSDGAYAGVVDALVRGVAVAGEELAALGRPDVDVGFSMMWRWHPDSDARFWQDIGAKATPAFRRALDYVGLQVYPGLVWPPAPLPDRTAGEEVVEALTLLRRCYMPKAALGAEVDVWVSENGYATNLGRTEAEQDASLASTVRDVHRWSGELGLTDYRWFNLRDNDSDGGDLFSAVGLLRDDYTRKPAFWTFRGLIGELGTASGERAGRARTGLRARVTPRSDRRGPRRFTTTGRLLAPPAAACGGAVTVTFKAAKRTLSARRARVRSDCRFRSRVTFRVPRRFAGHRTLRMLARFEGTATLRPARAPARRVTVAR